MRALGQYAVIGLFFLKLSSRPFVRNIAHCFRRSVLDPLHKGSAEFKIRPALGFQKSPHILSISVSIADRGIAVDWVGMPVKIRHAGVLCPAFMSPDSIVAGVYGYMRILLPGRLHTATEAITGRPQARFV